MAMKKNELPYMLLPQVTLTSDCSILRYYESRNDKKQSSEAYYYARQMYSDLGNSPLTAAII